MRRVIALSILCLFSAYQSYGMGDDSKEAKETSKKTTSTTSSTAQKTNENHLKFDVHEETAEYKAWTSYLDYKYNQINTHPQFTAEALRIYDAVFWALRNYNIDPSTITVILRPKQETDNGGHCNSITRTICIDETLGENKTSDDALNYVIHHEIGHLVDRGLQKINEARIEAGDQWNKEKELECYRQGELRADLLAVKYLIDANLYTPIVCRLIVLLENIAKGTVRNSDTHPTCCEEYTNIAQYLIDHNYKINFSYSGQSDYIKTTITITNSNFPTLKVIGTYPRKLIAPACSSSFSSSPSSSSSSSSSAGGATAILSPASSSSSESKTAPSSSSNSSRTTTVQNTTIILARNEEMKEAPNTRSQISCLPALVGMFMGGRSQ
jgi:hypothetical protein